MSLILEALNRSRDSSDAIPTLATQHPVESVGTGVRQYVPWTVVIVALALILWLVWRWLGEEPVTPPETGSPVAELTQNIGSAATSITAELKARAEERGQATQPPAVQSARPEASPAASVVAASLPEPAQPESVQSAATGMDGAEPESTGVEEPVEEVAVFTEPEVAPAQEPEDPAVARLYRDRSVPGAALAKPVATAAPTKREEQPLNIQSVLERAQEEMENSGADDHPVPLLTNLSQQTKNEIPTLYYHKHDYSNDAGKSHVTLNGKTVRVGGSPGPGLKVEEILPDSVVLDYRGTQFRLRALNSWINL